MAKTTRGRITPGEVEALMDEHTKIVSLSAVQAGTGYFADLKAIGALCRSSGALLAVDAIQALGRIPLNVRELGVGYLSCGGFKGLLSGLGTGFLWCDKRIMTQIIPPHVGFLSGGPYFSPPRVTPGDIDFQLADSYNRFEAGTHNVHGIALMESSVGLILELGPENIGRHVLDLERLLRQRLANTGFDVLTPESEDRRSGLLVLYYPKEHQQGVDNILQAHRIKLTHRGGYIRLAFGIHNTAEDVDKIAQAMEEIDNRILKGK